MNVRRLRDDLNRIIDNGGGDWKIRIYKDASEYFGWEYVEGARESTDDDHDYDDCPFCVLETPQDNS